MEEQIIEYIPVAIICLLFFVRNKFIATPSDLKDLKETILKEVKIEYVTKESVDAIRKDIGEIKDELKNLTNFLMEKVYITD